MLADDYRIPEPVFRAVLGTLFGLAIIAAVVRTVHRLRSHRRLFVDDLFLLIACIFLTASTIILYQTTTLTYRPFWSWLAGGPQELLKNVVSYEQLHFAYLFITWTAIFAVKFSFLFFFQVLVERIRYMTIYWRIVLGTTIIAFCLCVCEPAIECPHFATQSRTLGLGTLEWIKDPADGRVVVLVQCAMGPGVNRSVTVASAATTLDFLTDLMIIALPIHLLWKVRMKTRQKFGLGVFLCLSVFMMMTAVVRISVLHRRLVGIQFTAIDFVWKFFWLQVEACLAVLMVSLTALRSIFVSDSYRGGGHARARPIRPKMTPGASYRQRYWPGHKKSADADGADSDVGSLPSIPSATITGLRTFIRGGTTADITMTSTLQSKVHDHGGEEV
ncbi:MAG: hypothetical protein M1826_003604 [Phylliscum demangeonii]|nr:MAG: hypothetical protein M1826_003604 [Phylliscum demangeonii]